MNTQIDPTNSEVRHTEARTVAFSAFVLNGATWHITMREGATADAALALLRECHRVAAALQKGGAIFVTSRDARETLTRQSRRPHPPPNGDDDQQPVKGKGAETDWCPIHDVPMQQWKKNGRTWYAHRLEAGTWCRGKPPKDGN